MKRPPQELVSAFLKWFGKSEHAAVEDRYKDTVTKAHLGSLSNQDFVEFFFQFARDGGHIQSGGHRTAPMLKKTIEEDCEGFRKYILSPFEETFDIGKWMDESDRYKGWGSGIATIYLNRVDKKRFAIVNNKSTDAMGLFDVSVPAGFKQAYEAVRESELQLIQWFPEFENLFRTDALTHFLIGTDEGSALAGQLLGQTPPFPKQCWICGLGEGARKWVEYYNSGTMGVGWDEMNEDLTPYDTEEKMREKNIAIYGNPADVKGINDFVNNVAVGDGIFVKKGTGELVGYGIVESDYNFHPDLPEYRHIRKVKWLKQGNWPIPDEMTHLPRKTITPLTDPARIQNLINLMDGITPGGADGALFTRETFDVLEQLDNNQTQKFYSANQRQLQDLVENPFQELFAGVIAGFPQQMLDFLETEKGLFSRFVKNDYGKGGAWPYYWGAFYPKQGKRTADAQLFVVIKHNVLQFGFYIGDYGEEPKKRFIHNCKTHRETLVRILEPALSDENLDFGEDTEIRRKDQGNLETASVPKWDEWLGDPETSGIQVRVFLSPDRVIRMSRAELVSTVGETFRKLFPLVILSYHDEPLVEIDRYLDQGAPAPGPGNSEVTLESIAGETGLELGLLESWKRAIERKGQAIIYGPPGTGKTFVAELFAKHLAGQGSGIIELVQFHPSYAYEDFIQGIRPKARAGGGLDYPTVPGRFLSFCGKAMEQPDDISVLIIDEINRADLSRVFGELMYLLEYRKKSIPLSSGGGFSIPKNVRIIGTMNTADRSIALVDHALRRRFAFLALYPKMDLLRKYHSQRPFKPEGLIQLLEQLNRDIVDPNYAVGVSFFMRPDLAGEIADIWQTEIEPYLEEFFFDQPDVVKKYRWGSVQAKISQQES